MRIVLKVGGNVLLESEALRTIAGELHALRAHGHDVVLVHGGGPQLDDELRRLGEPTVKVDGLRVTSPAAADAVLRVLDGIGGELARGLAQLGVPAHHTPARKGGL
ncbi:MAG TPA: acetylglutamate kinase, partial [Candidatus Thermoplasmatota archaeon]|nr:acetylglutamate kinase [Candidatus Thermoplasmatota archaeon]